MTLVITVGLTAVLVNGYLAMYQSLNMLMAKSSVTSSLRNAFVQLGRDVQSSRRAVQIAQACGGFTASATVLILEQPGGAHIIYACDLAGACQPNVPGQLERVQANGGCVTDESTRHVVGRDVTLWNLQLAATRVTATLGLRGRIQNQLYYESRVVDGFLIRGR